VKPRPSQTDQQTNRRLAPSNNRIDRNSSTTYGGIFEQRLYRCQTAGLWLAKWSNQIGRTRSVILGSVNRWPPPSIRITRSSLTLIDTTGPVREKSGT
jgi:hypothetical protein